MLKPIVFLLSAHFDALFDTGFITFTDDGHLLRTPKLAEHDTALLGLECPPALRWISPRTFPSSPGTGRMYLQVSKGSVTNSPH